MTNNQIFDDIDAELNHFNALYPNTFDDSSCQYYSNDNFNLNFQNIVPTDFKIIHINIRSIAAHGEELGGYLKTLNARFDVICISETWANNSSLSFNHYFPSYKCFNSNRSSSSFSGGGVAVLVSEEYEVDLMENLTINCDAFESVFVKINFSRNNITKIGCIYRPPNNNHEDFLIKFNETASNLQTNSSNCIISGDFNYCLLKAANGNLSDCDFYETANSYSLLPLIKKPTRIASRIINGNISESISLIDNILTNCISNTQTGIYSIEIADHMPIFAIFRNFSSHPREKSTITYRQCSESNLIKLVNMFQNCINIDHLVNLNVDESIETLHSILLDCYNATCPIKTKTLSQNNQYKPWISAEILAEIKKKQNLFNLLKTRKISPRYFNSFKNKVTDLIKYARKDYYKNLFISIKNDTKRTWKIINNIIKPNRKYNSNIIKTILFNNRIYDEPEKIASLFNTHFSTIGKKISDSFQNTSHGAQRNNIRSPVNSFSFSFVTSQNVKLAILSLKSKSCHISMYPVSILKLLEPILSPILASIINKSFQTGTFPKLLKIAKVIPLYKANDKQDITNYRPISILHPISKIFERIIFKQLLGFLNKFSLLNKNQYGFRPHRSTTQAILDNLNFIYENLDDDHTVISIFLDFSKAFDCIDHTILLRKLYQYGIRGIANDYFRSYLSDRSQYVRIGNKSSNTLPITHGVPQGSVLGPILFLLFINDFPCSSIFFKFTLFADDSNLLSKFKNSTPALIHSTLQNNLQHVYNWLQVNKIKVNVSKCKFIIFSYGRKTEIAPLRFGDGEITETNEYKFLGVILDNRLTFKSHINHIKSKISQSIGILYKLNKFMPPNILKTLYETLIKPYITYGIEAWHSAPNYILEKVRVLQKKSIRAICDLSYNAHTNECFKTLKLLKIDEIFTENIAVYIYNTLKMGQNANVSDALVHHRSIHDHNTRNRDQLVLPRNQKSRTQKGFLFRGIKEWNNINQEIKNSNNVRAFRRNVKNFLLSKY